MRRYRENPFIKYLTKEDFLHNQIISYLSIAYPYAIYFHPINEGKRTPFERFKAKILGIKAGLPDIMILNSSKEFKGLAIEVKFGKNKLTENQRKWLNILKELGWRAEWVNCFDNAKKIIDDYFKFK